MFYHHLQASSFVTLDPAPATRYDLRFSALGVPVRVHPMFWLASIVFGIQLPPRLVVIWVGVVFISILIHELGHALTIRAFGWYPLILLYTFGGLAIYQPTHRDPRKELLISLAGPAAGLLFGALIVLVLRATHHEVYFKLGGPIGLQWSFAAGITNVYLRDGIDFVLQVTIWWSLINLLPVYPLDGGQSCRQILLLIARSRRGDPLAEDFARCLRGGGGLFPGEAPGFLSRSHVWVSGLSELRDAAGILRPGRRVWPLVTIHSAAHDRRGAAAESRAVGREQSDPSPAGRAGPRSPRLGCAMEVLAALGHGRSYGLESRVLGRSLPGILQSGLWPALAARQSGEVAALVTDVGNDIVYGARPAAILEWIAECLTRLAVARARTVITLLPLAGISALPPWRYRLLRTLLFPGCRLSFADALDCAFAVQTGLVALAARFAAVTIEPRTTWYRFDPIHLGAACGRRLGAKSFRAGKTRRRHSTCRSREAACALFSFAVARAAAAVRLSPALCANRVERSATARRLRCIESRDGCAAHPRTNVRATFVCARSSVAMTSRRSAISADHTRASANISCTRAASFGTFVKVRVAQFERIRTTTFVRCISRCNAVSCSHAEQRVRGANNVLGREWFFCFSVSLLRPRDSRWDAAARRSSPDLLFGGRAVAKKKKAAKKKAPAKKSAKKKAKKKAAK